MQVNSLKDDSSTTKLRVVIGASSKTNTGYSLNDLQMTGPVLQDELLCVLLISARSIRRYTIYVSTNINIPCRNVVTTSILEIK